MRFIGSKDNLIEFIWRTTTTLGIKGGIFFDIFTGTTKVAQFFKKQGYQVISNDNLYFSYLLQRTYIENNDIPNFRLLVPWLILKDAYNRSKTEVANVIDYLNGLQGLKGFVFENYAKNGEYGRMYFSDNNAQKIDSILDVIAFWSHDKMITDLEGSILRSSLIESIPFISNISGTYGAYLKYWDKRALNPITLEIPEFILSNKQHICLQKDANEIVADFDVDLLYLDPPYNNRQYISNYHVLETIAQDDKIKLKGKTGLRTDDYKYKSRYSQKRACIEAFQDLIYNARSRHIIMSYNSEGIIPANEIERIFRNKGKNYIKLEKKYRRFKSNLNGDSGKSVIEQLYCVEVPRPSFHLMNSKERVSVAHGSNVENTKQTDSASLVNITRNGINYGERGIYDIRNKLNDLTGREWVYRTNSVEIIENDIEEIRLREFLKEIIETKFSTRGKESFSHGLRSKIPSPKPPQLMKLLIEFFTKEQQWILDPFMGVGGTLLGASLSNRNAVGIDLSEEYVDIYKQVCVKENLREQAALVGNSKNIDQFPEVTTRTFDLVLTDPPYSNMMMKKKTGEATKKRRNNEPTPFTALKEDIGNLPLPMFLRELKTIIASTSEFLKDKGYIIVFTKDFQPSKEYHGMLHSDIVNKLLEIPYIRYKGYKVWYDKTVNLYPYGYPFAYVSNQLHQFILLFRKEI